MLAAWLCMYEFVCLYKAYMLHTHACSCTSDDLHTLSILTDIVESSFYPSHVTLFLYKRRRTFFKSIHSSSSSRTILIEYRTASLQQLQNQPEMAKFLVSNKFREHIGDKNSKQYSQSIFLFVFHFLTVTIVLDHFGRGLCAFRTSSRPRSTSRGTARSQCWSNALQEIRAWQILGPPLRLGSW